MRKLTVVHPGNTGPELLLPQPLQRVRRLLAAVRPVPLGAIRAVASNDIVHRVRRHLEHVALARRLALLNLADLLADADQRLDEAVQLLLGLGLGRLDHERVGHGPAHRRRVEAVVLQTLGNVDGLDAGRVVEGPDVEDELVCAPAVLVRVQDLVVRLELAEEVVGVEQRDLGGLRETLAACPLRSVF